MIDQHEARAIAMKNVTVVSATQEHAEAAIRAAAKGGNTSVIMKLDTETCRALAELGFRIRNSESTDNGMIRVSW